MEITKRHLILGGGHVAALTLLLLAACGPGGDKHDSGQTPDAGPMADADVDMPDTGLPPDGGPDLGTMPDLGVDGGTDECTPEMLLNRVRPPCEPDRPVGVPFVEDSFVIACLDTMNGDVWADSSGSGSSSIIRVMPSPSEPEGGIAIYVAVAEMSSPAPGEFTYGRDGIFYSNEKNAAVLGSQGNHVRLIVNADCTYGTVQAFVGGNTSDTPDAVGNVWRQ